ncbi:efflux transporter outer membrane subunit [Mucilaginibacter pallidiroseus]|uniref:Efflux transporter outer membrane subunit n=1 Tax=Mucilaginibacter pallidiroseus TaxID=2599295 RepID=A0A563U305_9SPHI|nr:efflux transporter outer membrane subunit [Mucilaginibacter pallidiroseus]TWR25702.1 efflux transporter outer membrane subunit [Mucilaginibacter pallidiroseus]
MITQYKKQTLAVLATALLFASCVTKKYQQPGLAVQGKLYRDTTVTDSTTIAALPYSQLFSDTVLRSLINEGIKQNLDLKTAVQRINEAQATLGESNAAFFPSLSVAPQVTRVKQSRAALNFPAEFVGAFPLSTTTYQIGLNMSWEADIWGKLSSAKRAALASLLQSDAARRAVQTQLIANIANNYYNLLALDQQLRITEQTLKNRIADVETMKALKESAVVTGAAVVQSEANRYAAEVTIPDLKRSIRETENALSILLARSPGSINRSTLEAQMPYSDLKTGVPSQLLKNRPDVQQAEFAFRASFENTNLARTYFYPSLTLTAQGGVSSLHIKNLFDHSIFYNIVGGLTQPIFNKGQNKARLRIAKAQQEEAYYAFQQSLLTAGGEVSNALYAYQTAIEKQGSRVNQLKALQKSVEFTKELLRYSSATNYTDVLTSEQALLAAQLSSVNDKLQELQSIVNLYRALGGGWQ